MRFFWMAAIAVVLAACGGGGKTSTAKSATSTTVLGHDQATTPFCVTWTQLNNMKNPQANPTEANNLLADAVKQSPAALHSDMQVLTTFVRGHIGVTTSAALNQDEATKVLGAINNVGTYLSAHCGIALQLAQ